MKSADKKHAEIQAALESLAKKGLVVNSGRRRLNKRTGEMEIVWEAVPAIEVSPGRYVKKEGWQ